MIYIGEFCDTSNRVLTLRFITPTGDGVKYITLGASPFVTSMKEGKTLYSPALYEAATAQIVMPDYPFDLYSGQAQGVRVELFEDDKILWVGYVEPTIYKQGFTQARETISVNCISALASLQYLPHNSTQKNVITTFADLIARTLRRCNAYTDFYFPANIEIADISTDDTLSSLVISEENFFDKRRDPRQSENDLAWKCRDVLEEICTYFGVTVVAYGQVVIFIDYDALKAGDTHYYHYDVAAGKYHGLVNLANIGLAENIFIDGETHAAGDASLSLEKIYNKVEIADSFYAMDDVTVDPFDASDIVNITSTVTPADLKANALNEKKGTLYDVIDIRFDSNDTEPSPVIRFIKNVYKDKSKEWGTVNLVLGRFLNNPKIELYTYGVDNTGKPSDGNILNPAGKPLSIGFAEMERYTGAALAQISVNPLSCDFLYTASQTLNTQGHGITAYWQARLLRDMANRENPVLLAKINTTDLGPMYSSHGDWLNPYDSASSIWFTEENVKYDAATLNLIHTDVARRFAVSSINPSNYICLFNPGFKHITPTQYAYGQSADNSYDKLPFFAIKPQAVRGGLLGGDDTYIVISGKLVWHYDQKKIDSEYWENVNAGNLGTEGIHPYPVPSGQIDPVGRKKDLDRNYMYIPESECWTYAFLRYDGRSWDGSQWVEDPDENIVFKLWYFPVDASNDDRTVKGCISSEIEIRNTVNYTMGIGNVSGTAIPLPLGGVMLEQVPVFGLCKPHDPALWYKDDEGPYYYTLDRVFIKDLKIQVTAGNKLKTDTESDTTFTNIIDEGNAVELPSIKLRITTYDTKKFSYSNVGIRTAVGIRFLSRFINRALHEREINACQIDNGEYAVASEGLCAEEHLVFKYTEQYSNPARALSMTMHGARISPASIMTDKSLGPECKMVPATIKRDYRFNTAQVKLVEKF